MPDGMSGLSMSEMGIAVKKAGKAIQKAGSGAMQQAAQQITGQAPNQTPTSKPEPTFETDDSGNPLGFFQTAVKQVSGNGANSSQQQKQPPLKPDPQYYTSDTGDPVDLFGGVAKQVIGSQNKQNSSHQAQQQGTFVMPKNQSSQPPSEVAPKQAGSFDMASLLNEQTSFSNAQPATGGNVSLEQELAKQKAEDEQKLQKLRNQLHQLYYDEFVTKAEGKSKKEETVQEKLEREKREEEEKKAKELEEKKKKEEVPLAIKGRQGSHEGLKIQG